MTLEELKKLISKDETKNIELRFNPWVYGNDPYTFHGRPYYRLESVTKAMPREQCLGICLMLEFGLTCRTNIRGK